MFPYYAEQKPANCEKVLGKRALGSQLCEMIRKIGDGLTRFACVNFPQLLFPTAYNKNVFFLPGIRRVPFLQLYFPHSKRKRLECLPALCFVLFSFNTAVWTLGLALVRVLLEYASCMYCLLSVFTSKQFYDKAAHFGVAYLDSLIGQSMLLDVVDYKFNASMGYIVKSYF